MVAVAPFKIKQFIDKKAINEKGYSPVTNPQPTVGSDGFEGLVDVELQNKNNSGND